MMAKMGGRRIEAQSTGDVGVEQIIRSGVRGAQADVAALASLDAAKHQLAVLVWHYHDDDVPGPDAAVDLALAGLPADVRSAHLTHYRIDGSHSNAYAVWQKLGSPTAPNKAQYAQLEAASELAQLDGPASVEIANGAADLKFSLPRQGVSLVLLDWSGSGK
jgi:xylan 1,4-beta-xylosidase